MDTHWCGLSHMEITDEGQIDGEVVVVVLAKTWLWA